MKFRGIISVDCSWIDQLLSDTGGKMGVHSLFVDFKKAYDFGSRGVLYNIPIECCIFMKLIRLIKMNLNWSYSKVHVGKYLSGTFPV
jgi:hypothetical protein